MRRRTFLIGSAAAAATAAATAVGGGVLYRETRGTPHRSTPTTRRYGDTTFERSAARSDAPNVLFIALDDCNDWLGFLNNHPGTRTPNLDALAAKSLSFTKAYCVAPMCNPARTGIMFGRQPFTGGVYDHSPASFEKYDAISRSTPSLVDDVWLSGYTTIGTGKVFNNPEAPRWDTIRPASYWADWGDRKTAEADRYDPNWLSPYDHTPEGAGVGAALDKIDFGPSGRSPADDPEGQASAWVAERLRDRYSSPFFLAYGAICTHLPWRIPQQFFDMHPLDEIVLPPYVPADLDDLGSYAKTKIIDPAHVFAHLYQADLWASAVQAYQAAISYADDCVGRVLDQLASSPYAENTIVVLWSDHGFHLGEKLHIEKFTIWERGTHIPMLIHAPGTFDRGETFDRPVSAIDIGPTVMDLVGGKVNSPTHEGRSLLPVVKDPALADERPPVMTWLPGNNAVRRDKWRYIRYVTGEVELYDQSTDPEELTNLAKRPETYDVQRQLAGYLPAIPPGASTFGSTTTLPKPTGD